MSPSQLLPSLRDVRGMAFAAIAIDHHIVRTAGSGEGGIPRRCSIAKPPRRTRVPKRALPGLLLPLLADARVSSAKAAARSYPIQSISARLSPSCFFLRHRQLFTSS